MKLDPSIKTPVAELQETLDMQVKLRDMQSTMNMSLRFLDSLKEQLKQAQTTMKTLNKEPDKDMMKALEDYIKEVDKLQDRLSARNEGLGFGGKIAGGRMILGLCSLTSIRISGRHSGSDNTLRRSSRCIALELKR